MQLQIKRHATKLYFLNIVLICIELVLNHFLDIIVYTLQLLSVLNSKKENSRNFNNHLGCPTNINNFV